MSSVAILAKMAPAARELNYDDEVQMFLPWAKKPQFFAYGENVTSSALQHAMIVPHAVHIRRIFKNGNPYYTKLQMIKIMMMTNEENNRLKTAGWNLPSDQVVNWATRMGARLRTAFRHIPQARNAERNAPWFRLLMLQEVKTEKEEVPAVVAAPIGATAATASEHESAESEGEGKEGAEEEAAESKSEVESENSDVFGKSDSSPAGSEDTTQPADEDNEVIKRRRIAGKTSTGEPASSSSGVTLVYGFDRLPIPRAWRAAKDKVDKKQFTSSFTCPPNAADHDPVIAKWKDGPLKLIHEYTVEEYKNRNGGAAPVGRHVAVQKKNQAPVYWSAKDKSSNEFDVRDRPDRDPLVSVYKNGAQVVQIELSKVQKQAITNVEATVKDLAVLAAIDCGIALQEEKVTHENRCKYRDEMVLKHGLEPIAKPKRGRDNSRKEKGIEKENSEKEKGIEKENSEKRRRRLKNKIQKRRRVMKKKIQKGEGD